MPLGDCPICVADRQPFASNRRSFARFNLRRANRCPGLFRLNVFELKLLKHLAFRFGTCGRAGPRTILIDELLQLLALGFRCRVDSQVMFVQTLVDTDSRKSSNLSSGYIVSLPSDRSSVMSQVAPETRGRATRSSTLRESRAESVPAESACAGPESLSVRRAVRGLVRVTAAQPTLLVFANRPKVR